MPESVSVNDLFFFYLQKGDGTELYGISDRYPDGKGKRTAWYHHKKVYEIAGDVGYSDYKYFTAQFKKYTGMSPKDYRLGDRAGR
ncbi:AraC family transcriptional regulator [Blautia sp. RD014234]|nr:AraC family transcriptional regulator [Blautia parvula]